MPLDGPALTKALGPAASEGLETVHTTLCRREAGAFQRAAKTGDDLLVACTQESRLFLELNEETVGAPGVQERPIRFVNIRETGGWSKDAAQATPKIAALIAAAQLPEGEPVGTVAYRSAGRVLVIGDADAAARAAAMLADRLEVSLLLTRPGGRLAQERRHAVHEGTVESITGWLGAFSVAWRSGNPIDLDLCTRCNACIDVCPEGAIDFSYQIDLSKCTSHRACLRGLRGCRRDRLRTRAAACERGLRPRARPRPHAVPDAAPAAAGLLPRARRRGARRRGAQAARAERRVREAEVLRLQAPAVRAQPQRAGRLQRLHRRLLGGGDQQRGHHHRPHPRRAVPVRRLRRLHHGLPERRPRLHHAAPGRAGPAPAHHALGLPPGRRARRRAAAAQPRGGRPPRRRARPARRHRPRRARRAGARAAGRRRAHGVGRHRPLARRRRARRVAGLGAHDRRGGAAVPRGGAGADGRGAGDPRPASATPGATCASSRPPTPARSTPPCAPRRRRA